jgi:hypothetical protein
MRKSKAVDRKDPAKGIVRRKGYREKRKQKI